MKLELNGHWLNIHFWVTCSLDCKSDYSHTNTFNTLHCSTLPQFPILTSGVQPLCDCISTTFAISFVFISRVYYSSPYNLKASAQNHIYRRCRLYYGRHLVLLQMTFLDLKMSGRQWACRGERREGSDRGLRRRHKLRKTFTNQEFTRTLFC